ncbi:transglutaminase-like domain-containing protein [Halalkalibacter alkaliphilus]|uniref:Transglutaminase-like domain-containing protein n=1 Tax=Halalkalibacter alkaliphilus TaxID=2917993 RepID=A0A9X2CW58_9BACI|nr:transglutaminase-like domain-containing protein [Halalkalibacter alkaliphilus]MCL7749225.1 transglutaminase-like domain-containing protein [Halalkalibacter alkaliphilus]
MKRIDWLQSSAVMLAGYFLYLCTSMTALYFNMEAKPALIAALLIVALFEILFPVKKVVQRWPQLLLLMIGALWYSGWRPSFYSARSFEQLWHMVMSDITQLTVLVPTIFYIIGTWVLFLVAIKWFQNKFRTIAALFVCTVLTALIDTFTRHSFSTEIMLMVCTILALLVVHHFLMLRKKSPDGWSHLTYYPELLIIPVGLFFGLILTAILLLPDTKPLVTDPITAWRSYTATEGAVSSNLGNDRESSTKAREQISGYSRDNSQLGGSFDFDYSPVMTVETTDPYYWRGESRHYYSGAGWEDPDFSFLTPLLISNNTVTELSNQHENEFVPDRSRLETRTVTQTIEFYEESPFLYPVLFGAYSMTSIEIIEDREKENVSEHASLVDFLREDQEDSASLAWLPEVEEIHYFADGKAYPKKYKVVSEVPVIDEEALRKVNRIEQLGEWERYLQLPDELPERVSELAKEISIDQTNPYDQVKAIEAYLRETYEYTTEPDDHLGESEDFVDRFLFEVQEGYCDYFSTAMVILTRSLDIPARWVKGYTEGSVRDDEMMYSYIENNRGPGTYSVSNSNAHSWAEVYFEGYGWIPFEPTPAFSIPLIRGAEESNWAEREETASFEEENNESEFLFSRWYLLFASLVVVGLILFFIIRKKGLLLKLRWKRKKSKTAKARLIYEFESFLQFARRKGFKVNEHETMKETMEQWTAKQPHLQKDLSELLVLFEKAKYSGEKISQEEVDKGRRMMDGVREKMNGGGHRGQVPCPTLSLLATNKKK